MQRYADVVQKRNGDAVHGASVLVTTSAGATATIYSDNEGTQQANPMTTNSKGEFSFYAEDGRYNLTISGASLTAPVTRSDILLDDKEAGVSWLDGAAGDGETDDTDAIHAFLDAMAERGGQARVGPGTFLFDPYTRDYATNPGQPFTLIGAGRDQTILKLRSVGNAMSWWNATGVHVHGIGLDCNYSELGDGGHGVVFYNCSDCSADDSNALDFKSTGFIGYTDSTTTGTVYEQVFFRRCFADATASKAAGNPSNGVLLADYWRGGIIDCAAENVTDYGIELKQNARYNVVSNPRAKNCGVAFGMGQTTVGSDGCDYNIVSNVLSEDCPQGVAIGEGTQNLVNGVMVDMTNVAQADQVDAVRFDTDAANNTLLGLKTKGMRKPALRFISGADGNYAQVAHEIDTGGAHKSVAFDSGADNNTVEVGHVEGFDGSLATRITDSGTGNRTFYRRGRYEHTGSTGVIRTFGAGTPEGSVTAPVGSTYTRTDGGTSTTFYVKESGTGNTGWRAV